MSKSKAIKKVTVNLPEDLLDRALKSTQDTLTGTLRRGLELIAAADFFEQAISKKGNIKFNISLSELRDDK